MLTKIGNLSGLQSLKQSQLNLGVIQSLVGEVFNTDNCVVMKNSDGVVYRHPHGLQIAFRSAVGDLEAPALVKWAAPFLGVEYSVAAVASGSVTSSTISPKIAKRSSTEIHLVVMQISGEAALTQRQIAFSVDIIAVGKWKN